jgi:hypothetical protein
MPRPLRHPPHPIAGRANLLSTCHAAAWWYWSTLPERVAFTTGSKPPDWTPLSPWLKPLRGQWVRFSGPTEDRRPSASDLIGGGRFSRSTRGA